MLGQILGHYAILEKLGEGGMGVVYKAHDTHLERFAAVKVLSPGAMFDPVRQQRFFQEAKAASALNHPNIIHIYDISRDAGVDYIAMEYVAGKTLAEAIRNGPMPLKLVLQYALQICDALEAAHSAGIVHRDIKPENIIVSDSGLLKLLDFGLAKLTEPATADDRTRSMLPKTEAGTIMGTIAYMSPEQTEGRLVDARSDIFSFGAVLYEMISGRCAFAGQSKMATMAAILNRDPPPPGSIVAGVPAELDRIVRLCLRKQPGQRFQHAADLRISLLALKEDSESVQHLCALPARRLSLPVTSGIAAAVVALAAVLWFLSPKLGREALRVSPLTTFPGFELGPTFSPDGSQIAFSWEPRTSGDEPADAPNADIYVMFAGGQAPLRLTTDPHGDFAPAWSPDGRLIAFIRKIATEREEIRIVSPLGGQERHVTVATMPWLSWTNDNKAVVISDRGATQKNLALYRCDLGGERQKITSPPENSYGDIYGLFSPDEKRLAIIRCQNVVSCDIYISEKGSEPRALTRDKRRICGLAWTPDSSTVMFSSNRSGDFNLWRLKLGWMSSETPEKIHASEGNAYFPTIAVPGPGGGIRAAYHRFTTDTNILRADLSGPSTGAPRPIIASTRADQDPAFSPDGSKIAFSSSRSGNEEIWVTDSRGENPLQLTSLGATSTGMPRWSPDRQRILFDSNVNGAQQIFVISASGGSPRLLTTGHAAEGRASWSADGNSIYFRSDRSGSHQIWKMPATGGTPVQVTKNGGFEASERQDGRILYFLKSSASDELWSMNLADGTEAILPVSTRADCWGLTQKGVYFLDFKTKSQGTKPPRVTGPILKALAFDSIVVTPIRSIDLSGIIQLNVKADGQSALVVQTDGGTADLMLIEGLQ